MNLDEDPFTLMLIKYLFYNIYMIISIILSDPIDLRNPRGWGGLDFIGLGMQQSLAPKIGQGSVGYLQAFWI